MAALDSSSNGIVGGGQHGFTGRLPYFDQLGFWIVTPLVPVLLWLALERAFVRKLWVEMVLAGAAEATKRRSG